MLEAKTLPHHKGRAVRFATIRPIGIRSQIYVTTAQVQ
jgi:hypothetical protein